MRKMYIFLGILFTIMACQPKMNTNPDRFKRGIFEAPAVDGILSKSIITRNDSLQIERYTKYLEISTDSGVFVKSEKKIDSFSITWKNNFFYTLEMISPKTELDKDPIYVQIIEVTDSSYTFSAKIGYSNFKQEGVVYKLK